MCGMPPYCSLYWICNAHNQASIINSARIWYHVFLTPAYCVRTMCPLGNYPRLLQPGWAPLFRTVVSGDPHTQSHLLKSIPGCSRLNVWATTTFSFLPLLFLLQRCEGAWQLLYSIQFNMIRANENSRNCIWTAVCCSDSRKTVPTGLGRISLTSRRPVSFDGSPKCQTSDEMRHAFTPLIGIILWSALVLQSLQVSVSVRSGEDDKWVYRDNSVMKSAAS